MCQPDGREIAGELEWEMSERPHRHIAGRGSVTIYRRDIKVAPLSEPMAEAAHRACALHALGCSMHFRGLYRKQVNVIGDISIGIAEDRKSVV